jgi:hypothetical protein
MTNTDFDAMARLGFEWIDKGLWINRETGHRIWLNEDYRNTFRACTGRDSRTTLRNKAGNEIRFRTGDAAAKALHNLTKGIAT